MRLLFALLSLTSVVFCSNASFNGFYVGPQIGMDHFREEDGNFKNTGFQGGLTAGYMTEIGNGQKAVLGAEIFCNLISNKKTETEKQTFLDLLGNSVERKISGSVKQKYNFGGAFIAGVKAENAVPYLKLGYDFRKVESEIKIDLSHGYQWNFNSTGTNSLKSSKLAHGPLVGCGILYKVHQNIAVGLDYVYSMLGEFKPFKEFASNAQYQQNNHSLMVKTIFVF